jgi:hypothetical protein
MACVLFFIFRPDLMRVMMSIGNSTANSVWEANIKGRPKVLPSSSRYKKKNRLGNQSNILTLVTDYNSVIEPNNLGQSKLFFSQKKLF